MEHPDIHIAEASEDIEAAARYYRTGHLQQAEQLYRQVLQHAPNHPVALHWLGVIAYQNGRHDTAVELTGKAIASTPQIPQFHNTLGVALNALGRFDEAIAAYQQALKLTPDYADAHYNMGNSLASLGRYAAAVEQYNQALSVKPDDAYTYFNMGVALQKLGRHADAIESFSTVIQLNHDPAEAYKAMAASQQLLGRHTEAINSFRQALRFKPDCTQSHCDLGSVLLQTGNFTEGWREYVWRLYNNKSWMQHYQNIPRWDGSDFAGKRLLVLCEQGLGDNIQFVRYLPMVKERGGTVILGVYKQLYGLLKDFPCVDEIVCTLPDGSRPIEFDLCSPILDMPGIFGTTLETIPAQVPYLYADRCKADNWRKKLTGPDFKVGIVWGGRFRLDESDGNRGCGPGYFARLTEIPGVRLYDLQKGPTANQIRDLSDEITITNLGGEFEDFTDTAAAIENLDLIISVDTSVLHLAGAMGKPTWALLRFAGDWRWLLDRQDSPWYPTMKLFRQKNPGDWPDVFDRVAEELQKLISRKSACPQDALRRGRLPAGYCVKTQNTPRS